MNDEFSQWIVSFGVAGATKSNLIAALRRIGVHSLCRGDPIRWIVPPAAAYDFVGSITRSFWIAYVVAPKAVSIPIVHPLPDIAREIVNTERTHSFGVGTDPDNAVLVDWIWVRLAESCMLRRRRIAAPRIFALIAAARCPLPFGLGRQALAGPPAVAVGIMPINPGNRQRSAVLEVRGLPRLRRFDLAGCFQKSSVAR